MSYVDALYAAVFWAKIIQHNGDNYRHKVARTAYEQKL
jgi:hypothetical protein